MESANALRRMLILAITHYAKKSYGKLRKELLLRQEQLRITARTVTHYGKNSYALRQEQLTITEQIRVTERTNNGYATIYRFPQNIYYK